MCASTHSFHIPLCVYIYVNAYKRTEKKYAGPDDMPSRELKDAVEKKGNVRIPEG